MLKDSCFVLFLQFAQRYKMLSRAMEEKYCHSDGRDVLATREGDGKKRVVLEVESVSLHHTRKVRNMMTSYFSRNAHVINVSEQTVYSWRKRLSCRGVLSHVNYERYGSVPT